MKIKQSKIGISTALIVAFAAALSGCAEEQVSQQPRQTWALDVESDECGVSAIVQEYYETGAWRNGRSYSWDFFRQDQNSLLRTRNRGRDWNLLDYIVKDDRFQLQPECKSDFSRQQLVSISQYGPASSPEYQSDREGLRRYGSVFENHFRANRNGSGANLLCRVSPFSYRLGDAGGRALKTGHVQSCINVETGSKTFNVIRDN